MSQEITLAQFRRWIVRYADRIIEQEAYLAALDAAIGDGDHGSNMVHGMTKVLDRLDHDASSEQDIGALLRTVAMTLISNIGGAAGPLYGAFFLRAAKAAGNHSAITLAQLAHMFHSGFDGVQQRGKAELNEKTMLDALYPAVVALDKAATAGVTVRAALTLAQQAAEAGMKQTIMLQASKGRASYLGPRSVGHQDPGATSSYYLFETAVPTLGND
jgi:phosphoenolpyruvate---glycerone phosphotransferase subunit DhaL